MTRALEAIAEAWAGGLLAILTAVAAIAYAKRRLLSSVRKKRVRA